MAGQRAFAGVTHVRLCAASWAAQRAPRFAQARAFACACMAGARVPAQMERPSCRPRPMCTRKMAMMAEPRYACCVCVCVCVCVLFVYVCVCLFVCAVWMCADRVAVCMQPVCSECAASACEEQCITAQDDAREDTCNARTQRTHAHKHTHGRMHAPPCAATGSTREHRERTHTRHTHSTHTHTRHAPPCAATGRTRRAPRACPERRAEGAR